MAERRTEPHRRAAPAGTGPEAAAARRIAGAVSRARLVLAWEALWPRLLPLVALAALFLTLSWFGLWRLLPDLARYAALALFAIAGLAALAWLVRIRLPGAEAALARVEAATGAPHRPATAFADRLAAGAEDPVGRALWQAHRRRLLGALGRLRAGWPAPGLSRRDPFALRFLLALLFVVGFLFAGPERLGRIGEAFRGGESVAEAAARIDAWATPPDYTGKPPVFLTGDALRDPDAPIALPEGSVVTVRIAGGELAVVAADAAGARTALAPAEPEAGAPARPAADAAAPAEYRTTLAADGSVAVLRGETPILAWDFRVQPDSPPVIAFTADPAAALSGALRLAYEMSDDYGVVAARAEFAAAGDAPGPAGARPLYEAPAMPLSLPQLRTRSGAAETTRDLTSHPWAGATVAVTLVAADEAGQEGRSAPAEVTLPARQFRDPVARALVEQRRILALDANRRQDVAAALNAITIAPEQFAGGRTGAYLAIRAALDRTVHARDDDALREVADLLWTIALGLEDGNLSLAAQALRDAEEALRQALENGASDEEIRRLTEELRQAMQDYLQAMAEQMARNPQAMQQMPPGNAQMLTPEDLDRMLDRIQELSETGARDAARQMLSELRNMLENMQTAQQMPGGPQNGDPMQQTLDQLADMIRRQQQLMDQTFNAGRGERPGQPPGSGEPMTPEEYAYALRQLQEGQAGLQQQLQEMLEAMEGAGMEPGQLGSAGESMGEAADALGRGQSGEAVGEQGEALSALRQGAQALAEQMRQGQEGQNGQGGQAGRQGNGEGRDPLGRPLANSGPTYGDDVRVPDAIDTQRAREILEAIRRRLGDPARPLIERDYLERLLQQF